MRPFDVCRMAWHHLRGARLRTGLCAASVAVGVLAMLLIASAGDYGQRMLKSGIASLGMSGLTVYREQAKKTDVFNMDTASELTAHVEGVCAAMAVKAQTGVYRTGHAEGSAVFLGVNEQLSQTMQLELLSGRLLTAQEVRDRTPAAVIGNDLAEQIFGRTNAAGKKLRLTIAGQEEYYQIVGVVSSQSAALSGLAAGMLPCFIYVPYTCLAEPTANADMILVQCFADSDIDATGARVQQTLERGSGIQGAVRVQNMSGIIEQVESLAARCVQIFVLIGAIAFVVALFGVLSGMLSAAREKRGEIGIYMAVGASRRDILRIFLLQAALLCFVGGLCGIAAAWMILTLIRRMTVFAVLLPVGFAARLLLISTLCGAAAGLLPAIAAARMDPVEAMKG